MDLPWLSQKAWAVGRYGHPVFRVPVDPGWGCPNRDAFGRGGCAFCAEDGGRARQLGDAEGPEEQVRRVWRGLPRHSGGCRLSKDGFCMSWLSRCGKEGGGRGSGVMNAFWQGASRNG